MVDVGRKCRARAQDPWRAKRAARAVRAKVYRHHATYRLRGSLPRRAFRRHAKTLFDHSHIDLRSRSNLDGRTVRSARRANAADLAGRVAKSLGRKKKKKILSSSLTSCH